MAIIDKAEDTIRYISQQLESIENPGEGLMYLAYLEKHIQAIVEVKLAAGYHAEFKRSKKEE